jgi:hypothetical protein
MADKDKPSLVRKVVRDLKYSSEQQEADISKTLGKELFYNKMASRLQDALVDSSLVIFDVDEDIEYRVTEAAALVNLRVTGLQGRTNRYLADLYDIWMEILSEEWVPLVKACRVAARRVKLRGGKSFMREGLEFIQDIKDDYGAVNVIPWAFKLIARSFGSEFELVQWVALVQSFAQDPSRKSVTVGEAGGTE